MLGRADCISLNKVLIKKNEHLLELVRWRLTGAQKYDDLPSPPPGHFGAGDFIGSGGGDGSGMGLVRFPHHSAGRKGYGTSRL